MKKIITILVLSLSISPAYADVYVKVDAEGNAISGPIVCDAATCSAESEYSRLTLQAGERYALQGVGVDYGSGNNNAGLNVKIDNATNEWVINRVQVTDVPVVQRFTLNTEASSIPQPATTIVETVGVINQPIIYSSTIKTETTTVVTDTATAIIETPTALSDIDFNAPDWYERLMSWLTNLLAELYARLEGLQK